jgi:hypothetical protein
VQINFTINIDDRLVAGVKRVFQRKYVTRGLVTAALGSALVVYAAPAITAFTSGNPISSSAVNGNFSALAAASWSVNAAKNWWYLVPDAGSEAFAGIGTNSPQSDLHVYSPSGNKQVATFESAGTSNGTFIGFTDHSSGGPYTDAQVGSVDGNLTLTGNSVIVAGSTNLGVRMGAATPDIPLQVASGTTVDLDAGTGYFQIGGDSLSTDDNLGFDYHTIQARTAAGAAKTLNLNEYGGAVTLGSTSASSNLTVNGTVTATSDITTSGNLTATGTLGSSNYPVGILLHSTGASDNGTKSCDSYCPLVNSGNTPYCVAAYSAGAVWPCGSTNGSTVITCLCASF